MDKINISATTTNSHGALIKDNRDNRYYFEEEPGMIRNYETLLADHISTNNAIVVVANDAKVEPENVRIIY